MEHECSEPWGEISSQTRKTERGRNETLAGEAPPAAQSRLEGTSLRWRWPSLAWPATPTLLPLPQSQGTGTTRYRGKSQLFIFLKKGNCFWSWIIDAPHLCDRESRKCQKPSTPCFQRVFPNRMRTPGPANFSFILQMYFINYVFTLCKVRREHEHGACRGPHVQTQGTGLKPWQLLHVHTVSSMPAQLLTSHRGGC